MRLNINTDGNKKLLNNENTRFFIWNIPACITCPFATSHCKASCYARKAERLYPSVLPSRQANFEASKSDSFVDDMIETINYHMARPSIKGKKIVFRIHESGDFYSKEYAMKWIAIAEQFPEITFMAYTKSVVYFLGVDIPENMIVRFSLWDDTDGKYEEMARDLRLPVYTAVEKTFDFNASGVSKCDCKDCARCGKCWDRNEKSIACIIH